MAHHFGDIVHPRVDAVRVARAVSGRCGGRRPGGRCYMAKDRLLSGPHRGDKFDERRLSVFAYYCFIIGVFTFLLGSR